MSTNSKIQIYTKQNNSISSSLQARNIEFTPSDLSNLTDQEEILAALIAENNRLKEIVKVNKPAPVPKEPKNPTNQIIAEQPKKEKTNQNQDDEEESYEDVKVKFNTITNMEDIKRAFCNGEYDLFASLVHEHNFKYYSASYNWAAEKDGMPEYIAKNLIRGFVRNLDDYRKYLFVNFRCLLSDAENKTYSYPSLWIVNSTDSLQSIIGSIYEDFTFTEITKADTENFLINFRKTNFDISPDIIDESYVH